MSEEKSAASDSGKPPRYGRATGFALAGTVGMLIATIMSGGLSVHASQLFVSLIGLGGAALALQAASGEEVRTAFPKPTVVGFAIVLGISLGLVGTGLTALTEDALVAFAPDSRLLATVESMNELRLTSVRALLRLDEPRLIPIVFVVIALAPGLAEEFMYRGLLPAALREANPHASVSFISLLFACMHLNLLTVLPLFVVGTFLGYSARAGTGWVTSAIAHISLNAFNGIVFVRLYGVDAPATFIALIMVVVGVTVAGAVLALLVRAKARDERSA